MPIKKNLVIVHNDLISYVKEDSFTIFHEKYSQGLHEKCLNDLTCKVLEFEKPQILHALIVLTNHCNMACSYCYAEANEHLGDIELNGKEWCDILDSIKIPGKYRTQNLSFTGGEPTLHPGLLDILEHISGKFKVEISSNGLKIEDDLIDVLSKSQGFQRFNVSIDSHKACVDKIFRGNNFDKKLSNIEKLYDNNIPLCFSVVVSSVNVDSIEETANYFLEKFYDIQIKFIPLTKMGRASYLNDLYFLSEKDSEKYIASLFKMKETYGDKVLTDPSNLFQKNKGHLSGRCSHMRYASEKNLHLNAVSENDLMIIPEKCNAAYGVVSISPSGRLRPCLRPDSFYSDILTDITKEELMPYIKGKSHDEIGNLPFWNIVKTEAVGFNPLQTCALKKIFGGDSYGF